MRNSDADLGITGIQAKLNKVALKFIAADKTFLKTAPAY